MKSISRHSRLRLKLADAFNRVSGPYPSRSTWPGSIGSCAGSTSSVASGAWLVYRIPILPDSRRQSARRRRRRAAGPQQRAVEVFSLVFEASRRTLGLMPHDVQMVGGLALPEGRIVELPTGEGKTLVAVFPASLFALTGRGVHVLTFNDYLARRDADWMGPVYRFLGLSVGFVQEGMSPPQKREPTPATSPTRRPRRPASTSSATTRLRARATSSSGPSTSPSWTRPTPILIDEARIPLVIAGAPGRSAPTRPRSPPVVRGLEPGVDFETDDERSGRLPHRSRPGQARAPARAAATCTRPRTSCCWPPPLCPPRRGPARARRRLHRPRRPDRDRGRVHRAGRRQPPLAARPAGGGRGQGRAGSEAEGRILGSITLQHFFRLYPTLCRHDRHGRARPPRSTSSTAWTSWSSRPTARACATTARTWCSPDKAARSGR